MEITVIRIEATSAVPKPSTINPGVKFAAKSKSNALITNVNKPRVRKLIGNVRSNKIGFRSALIKPMMRAATSAVVKFSS